MLEESGRVVDIDADGVWVETIKMSACASCSARSGCGQSLLASVGQGKRSVICVDNPSNLAVSADDQVVIGIGEGAFMRISVLLYLIPLLTLFIAAVIAKLSGFAEPVVIGSGITGLIIGLGVVRYTSRTMMKSCKYHPVLLKVF